MQYFSAIHNDNNRKGRVYNRFHNSVKSSLSNNSTKRMTGVELLLEFNDVEEVLSELKTVFKRTLEIEEDE